MTKLWELPALVKAAEARAAVESARDAFPTWSATAPAERRRLLELARDLLLERQTDIAGLVSEETNATLGWGMFNVVLGAEHLGFAASQAEPLEAEPISSHIPGRRAYAVRQPVGVVVAIAPWNAPVILAIRALAAPLAYGNTVVLKASEQCPRTHGAIVDIFHEAGLPDGAVNLVTNEAADAAATVEELIAHPAVRRISFTGSTKVGRIIAESAGRHLKRVVLELGGKAPLIVLADADLEQAAAAASFGAFMHGGQICMATERIIVDRTVAEQFVDLLADRARALNVGDRLGPHTQIGPLVNAQALERVRALVDDAESKGAKVVAGGSTRGACFEPTVVTGVTPEMRLYGEESFGPVVGIVEVAGVEEAVRVANDTEYGLAASVFSRDVEEALVIARRLETGICHVNDATVGDEPQMPFGGVKDSGWGRFGGKTALEEFTELRWITVLDAPRTYPI
jgi:acyl-CoA reductase-like NAD-dependent aldehyde dehydrogenase